MADGGSKLLPLVKKGLNVVSIGSGVGAAAAIALRIADGGATATRAALSIYTILFCGSTIAIELGVPRLVREAKIHTFWPLRGGFYGYLGVATLELTGGGRRGSLLSALGNASGWTLVGLGALYTVLGATWVNKPATGKKAA